MNKKLLAVICALAVLAFSLAGCNGTKAEESPTLSVSTSATISTNEEDTLAEALPQDTTEENNSDSTDFSQEPDLGDDELVIMTFSGISETETLETESSVAVTETVCETENLQETTEEDIIELPFVPVQ